MIGQKSLIKQIEGEIDKNVFPRFSIVVGIAGSEKNEFPKFIAETMSFNYIQIEDCKVDTVRDMIVEAYRLRTPTVYGILDADNMSTQARNSLLKVTEEPPNKAYFVMTLENVSNTLPTIQSRASVYSLQPYDKDSLLQCCKKYSYSKDVSDIVLKLCETLGDIDVLSEYNPKEFYSFVEKVVEHIGTASGSNSFKISQNIKFKDTDESGYNLNLFWRAFINVCFSKRLYSGVNITSKYLSKLRNKSINKNMLFDLWILDIRRESEFSKNGDN